MKNQAAIDYLESTDGKWALHRFITSLKEKRVFAVIHRRTNTGHGRKYIGIYQYTENGVILHFNPLLARISSTFMCDYDGKYMLRANGYASSIIKDTLDEAVKNLKCLGYLDQTEEINTNVSVL